MRQGLRVAADGRLEGAEGGKWIEANVVLDHTGDIKNGIKLKLVARSQQLFDGTLLPYWNLSTEANLLHPATR